VRALVVALLVSCAHVGPAIDAGRPAAEVWLDARITQETLYCAVAQIDGLDIAAPIANAEVWATPGLAARTGMSGTFFTPNKIGLDADADSAWHSAWRYEALCRMRLYLIDGKLGTCTADRWEKEIKPRYASTLSVCYREVSERHAE
jgi:hypothetical protein